MAVVAHKLVIWQPFRLLWLTLMVFAICNLIGPTGVGQLGVQVPLKGPCLRHGCLIYQFGVVSLENKNLLLQFVFVVVSHWVKYHFILKMCFALGPSSKKANKQWRESVAVHRSPR